MSAYAEVAPLPALRPFVECLWGHRIDGPPPAGGRRLLPSGRVDDRVGAARDVGGALTALGAELERRLRAAWRG